MTTIVQRHRQTDGRTGGRTLCRGNTALCVASRGKNAAMLNRLNKIRTPNVTKITHMYTMTYRLLPTLPPISQHATCARLSWSLSFWVHVKLFFWSVTISTLTMIGWPR